MLMFFKYSLVLISLLSLTACLPFENSKKNDNDKRKEGSSKVSLLPAVNNSLSTESPVGIWMLDIDAMTETTNFHENNIDIKSIERSKHKIREFISISKLKDGDYQIKECSLYRQPNIVFANGFFSSVPFTSTNNKLSLSFDFSHIEPDTFQVLRLPLEFKANLDFIKNLSLQGTASQLFKNRTLEGDPLFPNEAFINQENLLKIKGVKVSDETNFFSASELTTHFTINDMPFLNSEETAIRCLRIEDITTVTNHSDTSQKVSHSTEKLLSADFNDTNSIFLQILASDDTKKDNLRVFSNDSIFPNLNIPFYLSDCDESAYSQDKCKKVSDVKLNLKNSTSNILESLITASTSDNNEVNIQVSIEVH